MRCGIVSCARVLELCSQADAISASVIRHGRLGLCLAVTGMGTGGLADDRGIPTFRLCQRPDVPRAGASARKGFSVAIHLQE